MDPTGERMLAEDFEPSFWDSMNLVVPEMAKVLWLPARDKVLEALQVVSELSGYPIVHGHDLDLAAFVFALADALVTEVSAPRSWQHEFLQRLAAHVYLRTPTGDLPDPTFYWLFLAGEATAYRRAVRTAGPDMKIPGVVNHFLSRYDLGGSEDPELVHGICQLLAPVIQEARPLLKARVEPMGQEALTVPPTEHIEE